MSQARFITFEGGEGGGKSTQLRRLADRLRDAGLEVTATREPGGSEGGEQIRDLILNGAVERWSPVTETLLMYASRRDHLERVIRPALSRGAWVVSDRFHDSTRAYQGAAGGAPADLIQTLEREVLGPTLPDLTLILDMPVSEGLARAAGRGPAEARFEAKGEAFHERLRQAFLEIAAREPGRCAVIDAKGSPDEVEARIWAVVAERLAL